MRFLIAYPNIQNGKILSVCKLSCCGEEYYEATRALFEQVLKHEQQEIF